MTLLMLCMFQGSLTIITVYCDGANPDAFGNFIERLEIDKWNVTGEHWYNLQTLIWDEYNNATGFSLTVDSNCRLRFVCRVMIHNSCASSSNEAGNFTRVLVSISEGVFSNETMIWAATQGPSAGFYKVSYQLEWDEPGEPIGDTQYEAIFDYEVYR